MCRMKKLICPATILLTLIIGITITACSPEAVRGGPTRGIWDGNIYTNHYLNLQFELPGEWVIVSDEELAAAAGIPPEEFVAQGAKIPHYFWETNSTIIDMMATDTFLGLGIIITYEWINIAYGRITAPEYIDAVLGNLADMGVDAHITPGTTQIGGYLWYSYVSEVSTGDETVLIRNFVNIQRGFVRTISVIHNSFHDPVDEVLGFFDGL